jgi:hypothetical protein
MTKKATSNRRFNGTYGNIWVNGELFADVDSFEAKVKIDFEDVNEAGDLSTHKFMTGWSGDGSMTLRKIFSRGSIMIGKSLKEGICPVFTIVSKLADPNAYGAERISIKEVTFNEFTLMKFEQKTPLSEELSFNFADYDLIDLVEAN